jgi:hypothetical protein
MMAKIIRMVMAPTYISTWTAAKNSAERRTYIPATLKKHKTKNNAEWNMFFIVTTITPEPMMMAANM